MGTEKEDIDNPQQEYRVKSSIRKEKEPSSSSACKSKTVVASEEGYMDHSQKKEGETEMMVAVDKKPFKSSKTSMDESKSFGGSSKTESMDDTQLKESSKLDEYECIATGATKKEKYSPSSRNNKSETLIEQDLPQQSKPNTENKPTKAMNESKDLLPKETIENMNISTKENEQIALNNSNIVTQLLKSSDADQSLETGTGDLSINEGSNKVTSDSLSDTKVSKGQRSRPLSRTSGQSMAINDGLMQEKEEDSNDKFEIDQIHQSEILKGGEIEHQIDCDQSQRTKHGENLDQKVLIDENVFHDDQRSRTPCSRPGSRQKKQRENSETRTGSS